MSYILFRVHWKICNNGEEVEKRDSYHKNENEVAEFIREVVEHNTSKYQFRTEGPAHEFHTHDGNLADKVLNSKKNGLWDYEVNPITAELK